MSIRFNTKQENNRKKQWANVEKFEDMTEETAVFLSWLTTCFFRAVFSGKEDLCTGTTDCSFANGRGG